jgi:large conductance mechanosensitive channel
MPDVVKEFREFIAGGNLVELAVAFVIGGLFASLVKALVDNILMPIVGILFGKPNFDQVMILTINDSQIRIGAFLTVAVTVVLTALSIFLFVVKPYNRFRRKVGDAPAAPTQEDLLAEIRDLLAARR